MVVLAGLLIYGLGVMRSVAAQSGEEPVRIAVVGEQWWWRVTYSYQGSTIESANEIRIPINRPVELRLSSADVIHSFWVPNLAGKVDMIPGRTTLLRFAATRPGTSRGQCAEYCGGAHAFMSFHLVALEAGDFESWLARESGDAARPATKQQEQGQALFFASGCGGCHTIRGTPARGKIGPDLTRLGSRTTIAAAVLPNNQQAIARWIRDNQHIKPENLMVPYRGFDDSELEALSAYLASLR
jgi:cytochrome c oxidase subunit 2